MCLFTFECSMSCDNTGIALPEYWPRLAVFLMDNAPDWEWDPQLLYDSLEFLHTNIKLETADDPELQNIVDIVLNKVLLSHFKVSFGRCLLMAQYYFMFA